jgi:ferredoxin
MRDRSVAGSEWLPQIDVQKCNGCGECIQACPTGALEYRAGLAELVAPALCDYCAACEISCPVGAIELPYLICLRSDANSIPPANGFDARR